MNDISETRGSLLEDLAEDIVPPRGVEERVVTALRKEGNLQAKTARWWMPAAAAAVLFLALGLVLGQQITTVGSGAGPGADYLLLLHPAPGEPERLDPEDELSRFEEYSAWAGEMAQAGVLVGGEELKRESFVLSSVSSPVMEKRAPTNAIQGYFLIRAPNHQQATAVARDCPHLRYGGTIEVRRIERRETPS